MSYSTNAQSTSKSYIYGKVAYESGDPLVGVNITIESSKKLLGTVSDKDVSSFKY